MYFTNNLELLTARSSKKHIKFRNTSLPQLKWIDVVNCINYNVCNQQEITTLDNFGIILLDLSPLTIIKDVFNDFCSLEPNVPCSAHLYVSLTAKAKTFGWHKDTSDVIFWQALGKTLFSVKEDSRIYEYCLENNDLLYIPAGIKHCTEPLTPRVGISLGIDYDAINQ